MCSRIPLILVRLLPLIAGYLTDSIGAKGTGTLGVQGPQSNGARIHTVEAARAVVSCYMEHGYNTIDTARIYGGGTAEEVG